MVPNPLGAWLQEVINLVGGLLDWNIAKHICLLLNKGIFCGDINPAYRGYDGKWNENLFNLSKSYYYFYLKILNVMFLY
jgi:hypothetical protein